MCAKPHSISDFPLIDSESDLRVEPDDLNAGAVILMDKPEKWSSFDVVKFVRNRIKVKKVGHAGTLDPLATGLLICCCGKATKTISQFQEMKKVYEAVISFGSSTPSFDRGTEEDHFADWEHIRKQDIIDVLQDQFTGTILQKPPVYSALRKNGKRLYKYARKGEKVEIESRPVTVFGIEMIRYHMPEITIKVICGKGTYIRSVAHDLGLALNSRAHLSALRRTKTGVYDVKYAYTPVEFQRKLNL